MSHLLTLLFWDTRKNIVRKASKRELFEAIYILTQLIPIGRVTTYKNIASILKTNPRLVGQAMKNNKKPIIIPCHRVIGSSGNLRNYSIGGVFVKKKLLFLEDIILNNNKVPRRYFIDLNEILDH